MAWIAYGELSGWDTYVDSSQNPAPGEIAEKCQDNSSHSCRFGVSTCAGVCAAGLTTGVRPFGEVRMLVSGYNNNNNLQPLPPDPAADSSYLKNLYFDRHHLIETFLSLQLPRHASQTQPAVRMFPRQLMEGSGRPMQAAADALCFALLGTVFKSQWLVQWARHRHQEAVSSLEGKLQVQLVGRNEEIAGALYLLGYCSSFKALAVCAGHRRIRHQTFLQRVRTLHNSDSTLAQTLIDIAQHMTIMYAPVERKGFDNAARRAAPSGFACAGSYSEQLSVLCLDMSDLLERVESTHSDYNAFGNDDGGLISDMSTLETSLKKWYLDWLTAVGGTPWTYASLEDFRHFPVLDNIFISSLHFRSYTECNLLVSYWIALLNMQIARMDLLGLIPACRDIEIDDGLMLETDDCANKLCQSLPWLTLGNHGFGRLFRSNAIVYSTSAWFRRSAQAQKLKWCWEVWKWIEDQGGIFSYCEM